MTPAQVIHLSARSTANLETVNDDSHQRHTASDRGADWKFFGDCLFEALDREAEFAPAGPHTPAATVGRSSWFSEAEEELAKGPASSGSEMILAKDPPALSWFSETAEELGGTLAWEAMVTTRSEAPEAPSGFSMSPDTLTGTFALPSWGASDKSLGAGSWARDLKARDLCRTLARPARGDLSSELPSELPKAQALTWFSETAEEFGGSDAWFEDMGASDKESGDASWPSANSGGFGETSPHGAKGTARHQSTRTCVEPSMPSPSPDEQSPQVPQPTGPEVYPTPVAWRPLVPSIGSVGHPDLCLVPCRFFEQGLCDAGAACFFCHVPHEKLNSLDKRNRDLLRAMSSENRCSVFAAVFMDKAPPDSFEAVRSWARRVGQLSAGIHLVGISELRVPGVKAARMKRIAKCLERMGVSTLINVAKRFFDGPHVAEACDLLLEELRAPLGVARV